METSWSVKLLFMVDMLHWKDYNWKASRKSPAFMDLEAVSYFRKLFSGHCCV